MNSAAAGAYFSRLSLMEAASFNLKNPFGLSLSKPCAVLRLRSA